MSQGSNAVVYALICGLILFIVLPHALAALDRWRFLRRLRRAFESGTLQPLWPSDAAVCPCEIKHMYQVWMNSVMFGDDEMNLPLLGGFTTLNDHQPSALPGKLPEASQNVSPGQTLRDRLLAFRRKPTVLPTTTQSATNPPATPQRFQGTLQFATFIAMPSPRTSKLYNNTPVNMSCSLPYSSPPSPPSPSNPAHRHSNPGVLEVSGPRVPDPPALPEEDASFLATLHIGVCATPLTLDASVIPHPPPPPPASGTETTRRDVPLHPMYRMGYAGGAGVMIVDSPPRRSRDEDEEDWGHQAWMWRAF